MAGAQKYPGASTAYWYQKAYPGSAMTVNTVVWHSTEGTGRPEYDGGSVAPTLTAVPDFTNRKLVWFQHFDFDVSARALVNAPGGVETNTLNVAQVEIAGTCDPATHKKWTSTGTRHLYMPELPNWVLRDLAAFVKWAREEHAVPLVGVTPFMEYPVSYGATRTRMTNAEWLAFRGHCGHQHVPENSHGDPGAFPMQKILDLAKGTPAVSVTPPKVNDTYKAVMQEDAVPAAPSSPTAAGNPFRTAETMLTDIVERLIRIEKKLS